MTLQILLIDESYTTRWLLKEIIQEIDPNADIFEANNGIDAEIILRKNDINLVITSINMPLMNGLTLMKKAQIIYKEKPALSVIVMHEFNRSAIRSALPELNILGYLEKPPVKENLIKLWPKGGLCG